MSGVPSLRKTPDCRGRRGKGTHPFFPSHHHIHGSPEWGLQALKLAMSGLPDGPRGGWPPTRNRKSTATVARIQKRSHSDASPHRTPPPPASEGAPPPRVATSSSNFKSEQEFLGEPLSACFHNIIEALCQLSEVLGVGLSCLSAGRSPKESSATSKD